MIGQQRFLKLRDGVEIYCDIREVGAQNWLVVTHGIGEHMGRHRYLTDLFGHALNIVYYDLRGHGKSGGERADVADFSMFMQDLDELLHFLRQEFRMQRWMLFGHSMGALISCGFLQSKAQELEAPYPHKVFLSAPPVALSGPGGTFARLAPARVVDALAALPFGMKLAGLVDLRALSHDPRVQGAYVSDPLNALKLHTRLVTGLAQSSKRVFSAPLNLRCPAFVAVGSEDRIVHVPSVEEYFSFVEKGVQLKVIEGGFHELHNEIEKFRKPYFAFLKSALMG